MQNDEGSGKDTQSAQSHIKATPKPVDSQPIGTPKPPSCDLHATLMRPQSLGAVTTYLRRALAMMRIAGANMLGIRQEC
jgi:hypothetical protein